MKAFDIWFGILIILAVAGDFYGAIRYRRNLKGAFYAVANLIASSVIVIVNAIYYCRTKNLYYISQLKKQWDSIINKA